MPLISLTVAFIFVFCRWQSEDLSIITYYLQYSAGFKTLLLARINAMKRFFYIVFFLNVFLFGGVFALGNFTAVGVSFAGEMATDTNELRFPDEPPAEPADYRSKGYRGLVPLTLKGATVVSDEQAMTIYKAGKTVFIDVMPFVPRPPNLPKNMYWRDKPRSNIEGSAWLANVGYGRLPKEMDEFFRSHLKRLSSGKTDKPLLFYCQAECWMSWNAAKRALEYGYKTVYWYSDGTDGWKKIGGKVVKAKPEPLPNMTRALTQ